MDATFLVKPSPEFESFLEGMRLYQETKRCCAEQFGWIETPRSPHWYGMLSWPPLIGFMAWTFGD